MFLPGSCPTVSASHPGPLRAPRGPLYRSMPQSHALTGSPSAPRVGRQPRGTKARSFGAPRRDDRDDLRAGLCALVVPEAVHWGRRGPPLMLQSPVWLWPRPNSSSRRVCAHMVPEAVRGLSIALLLRPRWPGGPARTSRVRAGLSHIDPSGRASITSHQFTPAPVAGGPRPRL